MSHAVVSRPSEAHPPPAASASNNKQHRSSNNHHHSRSMSPPARKPRSKDGPRRRSGGDDAAAAAKPKHHRSSRHSSSGKSGSPSARRRHHRQQPSPSAIGASLLYADDGGDGDEGAAAPRARPKSPPVSQQLQQPQTSAAHASPGNVRLSAPPEDDVVALEMPEYDSPVLRKSRVVSTRSRLEGSNGRGTKWCIHTDTPGGHASKRLRLIKAIELDPHEYDDVGDLTVEPSPLSPDGGNSKAKAKAKAKATADNNKSSSILNRSLESETSDVPPGKPQRTKSKTSVALTATATATATSAAAGGGNRLPETPKTPKRNPSQMDAIIQTLMEQETELEQLGTPTQSVENENNDGSHLSAEGDETLENSDHLPMGRLNQDMMQRSATWDNPDDFSCTEVANEDEGDYPISIHPVAHAHNNDQQGGAATDHGLLGSYNDGEKNDEEEEEEEEPRGYIQNYNYNTSPTPRTQAAPPRPPKQSNTGSNSKKAPSTESGSTCTDEQSIDPMANFKPYEEEETPDPQASLADIEDSFACDDEGVEYPKRPPPSLTTAAAAGVGGFSASSGNIQVGRLSVSQSKLRNGGTAHSQVSAPPTFQGTNNTSGTNHMAGSTLRRTSNAEPPGPAAAAAAAAAGRDRFATAEMMGAISETGGDEGGKPILKGSRRDSSAKFVGSVPRRTKSTKSIDDQEVFSTNSGGIRRGVRRTQSSNPAIQLSSIRQNVVSDFAATFCNGGHKLISLGANSSGKSNNNSSEPDLNQQSHSTMSSESSSSAYSFGIKGLAPIPDKHRQGGLNPYAVPDEGGEAGSTPFMQFDLQAADGIQVKTNEEVETVADEDDEAEMADIEGPSVREFNKSDLPSELPRRELEREPPQRASRRNIRLGVKRNNSNRAKPAQKPAGKSKEKAENEIVKRFFSFANSSFGSLASSAGELLDDDDEDMIFE